MNGQNRVFLTILPVLFFSGVASAAPEKIPAPLAKEIISFTLFNYDNLIADHYEKQGDYAKQLVHLLAKSTGCPKDTINTIVSNDHLNLESNPVTYMLIINKETKALCGYYFLDD